MALCDAPTSHAAAVAGEATIPRKEGKMAAAEEEEAADLAPDLIVVVIPSSPSS
uniref:Uncharacterized protein n=1 Tax=Oryza meridionalis TaxID=40149 RepID=A0A0E0CPU2_9ORYZ